MLVLDKKGHSWKAAENNWKGNTLYLWNVAAQNTLNNRRIFYTYTGQDNVEEQPNC